MKKVFTGFAAAAIALSATAALAESAASDQRAKLEALWGKGPVAERQVSSANRLSVLDTIGGTERGDTTHIWQTDQSNDYFRGTFAAGPLNR